MSLGASMPAVSGQLLQLWLDEAKAAEDSGLRFWVSPSGRKPQLSGVLAKGE